MALDRFASQRHLRRGTGAPGWPIIAFLSCLLFAFAVARPARAADPCPGGVLPPQGIRLGGGKATGQQPDLLIDKTCTVTGGGPYDYGQVNIVSGGTLEFDEPATADTNTEFWASAIVVEANGVLKVGSAATPYGKNGGFLTIYLYGPDLSGGKDPATNQGQGVLCKSTTSGTAPCGIPLDVWNDNGKTLLPGCGIGSGPASTSCIPGLDKNASDFFYQYGPLYGDGRCTNGNVFSVDKNGKAMCGSVSADGLVGYFGYKTLAVSYDGTLQMFGYKGADYGPATIPATSAGVSWVRLSGDLMPSKQSLTLDNSNGAVGDKWWRTGEPVPSQFVVTTTDYLPTHSELATIDGVSGQTVTFHRDCTKSGTDPNCPGAAWFHSGTQFPLKDRFDNATSPPGTVTQRLEDAGMDPDLIDNGAETRAAVALLTRSVRIVSGGDTIGQKFTDMPGNYYFGAHTIFRQGFRQVEVQGVELADLGQGGKIGHYPIHFHMARLVPDDTFVKDSSVDESNTRWYVIHSTQNVTLARNVGYKSIGHGYYFENGTETDNNIYSNIGILARAAIDNTQNPRKVPGILAYNAGAVDQGLLYRSDNEFPSVFWITNGWNDFEGNMAAGAEACGAAYWFVPTENSDTPDVPTADNQANGTQMKWDYDAAGDFGYAGLQRTSDYAGATPLERFYQNYATSTMQSFQTIINPGPCQGFVAAGVTPPSLPNVKEISSFAPTPASDLGSDPYYPHTMGARLATACPAATPIPGRPPVYNCNKVGHVCADGSTDPGAEAYCAVTVLDHYTSAFNWADGNLSAVWLRPQWYLLANSVLSDVQNGALTFITGGDFTHSSVIQGYWGVALDTIFIGHTQTQDAVHGFALDSGPFNNLSGEKCDLLQPGQGVPAYCLNTGDGISIPYGAFFTDQRLMNIYDGPVYQDSDVYLDVNTADCPPAANGYNGDCMYGTGPLGVTKDPATGKCYLPNAAIAWKQPNGFFYPPAFHTTNLFFDKVDIRHYVVDPLFQAPDTVFGTDSDFGQGGTYITDYARTQSDYCFPSMTHFNGFTGIDRQTELNDDDGTLTGLSNDLSAPRPLKQTISVNYDDFFTAPTEAPQCLSNIGTNSTPDQACKSPVTTQAPVTAKTSPYDYVATVVFHPAVPGVWDSDCSNPGCYGVPLFRQFLAGFDNKQENFSTREWTHWYHNGCGANPDTPKCRWPFIRMSGENISTRETLTINNGTYYLDTTVPLSMQKNEVFNQQGMNNTSATSSVNVFQAGETYTVFLIYAKYTTEQTYQIYVGANDPKQGSITAVRVPIPNAALAPVKLTGPQNWLRWHYDAPTGIVTVHLLFINNETDLDPVADPGLCQPHSFCMRSNAGSCISALPLNDPLRAYSDRVCPNWAVKDLDCPAAGCYGFQFTLPGDFSAGATPQNPSPNRPAPGSFPSTIEPVGRPDWTTNFLNTAVAPDSNAATGKYGPSCFYQTLPTSKCLDHNSDKKSDASLTGSGGRR